MFKSKVLIQFFDGIKLFFPKGVSSLDIFQSINLFLLDNIIICCVNGNFLDLQKPVALDAFIQVFNRKENEGLEVIRHSSSHIMAEAVKELYPGSQIAIGPVIKDGFYYDFYRKIPFSINDLSCIENYMNNIINRDKQIIREVWTRNSIIKYFQDIGELFKIEIIKSINVADDIMVYSQGDFIDLCYGPHLSSTAFLGSSFKLMKLSGSYWKNNLNNRIMQRIYGTAWGTEKDLRSYLYRIEESKKRDHRKLGREMQLFHQDDSSVGNVFWHEKGWKLYRIIENYIRKRMELEYYSEVKTPQMLDVSLWKSSGHWDKFRDAMFVLSVNDLNSLVIKPMNCPCHVQIFRQGLKSYRDLPLRISEFGSCHRNEPSGALYGLFRLRSFVQDDAHIFCMEDQIISETKKFTNLLFSVYKDFGFLKKDIKINFSDRPLLRSGDDIVWDKSEKALISAVSSIGLEYKLNPGEGAFYGPKLEFILEDSIGREWQCGTLQVDFVLPKSLDATYIGKDGHKYRPVILHRAILGSLERFIAVLIEHYSGRLPLWLSPIQVVVLSVDNLYNDYINEIIKMLKNFNIRVLVDLHNNKISYKIREFSILKIPIILVIGNNEVKEKTVSVRYLGKNVKEVLALDKWISKLKEDILPDFFRKD